MAGKITFTLQDYQEAATKWRSDLLMLPIIGIQDTLKFMTSRPGIRYKEQVGALSGDAQFGPYKPSRSTDFNLNVDFRTLETFFGSVVAKFEPNSAVSTLLGQVGDTKGDGQIGSEAELLPDQAVDFLQFSWRNVLISGVEPLIGVGFDSVAGCLHHIQRQHPFLGRL